MPEAGAVSAAHAARRQVMAGVAAEAGAEVLVCWSSGVQSFMYMDAPCYASGYRSRARAALVVGGGEPVLLVSPRLEAPRAAARAAGCTVVGADGGGLVAELARLVGGRTRGPVAVCGTNLLTGGDADALEGALGRPLVEVTAEVDAACARSDAVEREAAGRATAIAEEGYARALAELRPGLREHELVGMLDQLMRELGAEDNFLLMSASPHATSVNTPGDRILEEGDLVLAEISPGVDGVFTQICRTAVLGEPSRALVEGYELLRGAFRAGLAACQPGVPLGEVVAAVNEPIVAAGFGEYCKPPYMRTRGHGMGLGSPKPQDLRLGGTELIEEGMAFVLHPNQYLPTVGYLMCGDPVLVEAGGARRLTSAAASLDVVGC